MFTVTNLSKMPLKVTGETYLTPGASCDCKTVSEDARRYELRGWLMITEIETAEQQKNKDTTPDNSSGKKGGEK
ncbi:MAG TPA: hypothetical protein PKC89_11510 [Pyrinomonadaceae bacterium]|nr:hypothetical protein [Pyrinomonadaceae bacterium]